MLCAVVLCQYIPGFVLPPARVRARGGCGSRGRCVDFASLQPLRLELVLTLSLDCASAAAAERARVAREREVGSSFARAPRPALSLLRPPRSILLVSHAAGRLCAHRSSPPSRTRTRPPPRRLAAHLARPASSNFARPDERPRPGRLARARRRPPAPAHLAHVALRRARPPMAVVVDRSSPPLRPRARLALAFLARPPEPGHHHLVEHQGQLEHIHEPGDELQLRRQRGRAGAQARGSGQVVRAGRGRCRGALAAALGTS